MSVPVLPPSTLVPSSVSEEVGWLSPSCITEWVGWLVGVSQLLLIVMQLCLVETILSYELPQ